MYLCPRSESQLTYMIDIALTTEFGLLLAVCDDRSGPDYQVVELPALRVVQVGLAAEIAALTELLRPQQLQIPSARAPRWPRTAST